MVPRVNVSSRHVNSVSGWNVTGYESGQTLPTITLQDSTSVLYVMNLFAGGVVYAGVDDVSVHGGNRRKGPPLGPITLHVQSAAAGTVIGGWAALNAYLDGPGTAKVSRTANSTTPTHLEIDTGGSGSIEVTQGWRPAVDSCKLGSGVTVTSAGTISGGYAIHFSTGGTVQIDGVATGPTCV